jgi:hypothetical protein
MLHRVCTYIHIHTYIHAYIHTYIHTVDSNSNQPSDFCDTSDRISSSSSSHSQATSPQHDLSISSTSTWSNSQPRPQQLRHEERRDETAVEFVAETETAHQVEQRDETASPELRQETGRLAATEIHEENSRGTESASTSFETSVSPRPRSSSQNDTTSPSTPSASASFENSASPCSPHNEPVAEISPGLLHARDQRASIMKVWDALFGACPPELVRRAIPNEELRDTALEKAFVISQKRHCIATIRGKWLVAMTCGLLNMLRTTYTACKIYPQVMPMVSQHTVFANM